MESVVAQKQNIQQPKYKKRDFKTKDIYSRCLITRSISLSVNNVNKNIRETIETTISYQFEGKCINEGFVKLGSTKIITYSSGIIERGTNVLFEVLFECLVCFPVEGTLISCIAKNITKAGIRGESSDESPSPIVVFIARDHHISSNYFNTIQEGDKFNARIIGQRFELNDKYISIIAEVVKPKIGEMEEKKPKIVIEE